MKLRRSGVGWLMVLGALGYLAVGSVSPAHGYVPNSYLACFNSSEADLLSLERSMSPAINTYVQAGTPVTFSGNSAAPVTFAVASSAAGLSAPDIGSGLGTLQPGTSTYTFTSTNASATPGILVFWDASFSNATLTACEGMTPKTYTTQARTFTVVSPPPTQAEVAARKKQEEEAAANHKHEEEVAATNKNEPEAPGTGGVSLAATSITVRSDRVALVRLECLGIAGCRGKLTLTVEDAAKAKDKGKSKGNGEGKRASVGAGTCAGKLTLTAKGTTKKGDRGRGKRGKAKAETIGTATFAIPAGETATVELKLTARGRVLLSADHGRLNATLTIVNSSPVAAQAHTESVRLVRGKAGGETGKK